ncbi:MAG TPA: hypothetical protein VGS07_04945 [Thermoanaerobaculia bacterium]|jgi:hypothetical protein|nr:hypothetical protein [Thermoanaerobaculia bacterium]
MAEHVIDLDMPAEQALAALKQTAEDWGAQIQPGENGSVEMTGSRLHLPVVAGIRRGLVSGPVEVQPAEDGSRLVFRPEQSVYYVQTPSVMILILSVAGAVLTVLWPFYPQLMPIAPFGAIMALGGWFLVVSRLRTSGPAEFLTAVAATPPAAIATIWAGESS